MSKKNKNTAPAVDTIKPFGMKWAKVQVFFLIWVQALITGKMGYDSISGSAYDIYMDILYSWYPSLEVLDTIYGFTLMILVVVGLYSVFCFIKRVGLTTKIIPFTNLITSGAMVLYLALFCLIVDDTTIITRQKVLYIVVELVLGIINLFYFRKRKKMFVD